MEVNRNGARGLGRRGSAWPADAVFDRDGLSIGGVAAEDLAAEHGTPVVVYDADEIRDRCRELAARFPSALYAVKAFTARPAIRIAIEEGLGLLVASGGELTACLRAGPSRCGSRSTATTRATRSSSSRSARAWGW